jgi:hypothetical protein
MCGVSVSLLSGRYVAAVEQLTDATTALDTGAYGESEALVWPRARPR